MASHRTLPSRPAGIILLRVAVIPILFFLVLPSLIIVPMALTKSQMIQFPPEWISIHAFKDYIGDRQWVESTLLSFRIAFVAMLLAAVTGSTAAVALHRRAFIGRQLLVGLIVAPIVVPVVVLALGDYMLFARLHLAGSWIAITLAQGVLATPFVFISVQTSLAAELQPALVRAAYSLGANRPAVLCHVYWPAIRLGVFAGAMLAFAVSFDEVVIAFFLQGADAVTLPVRMYSAIQYELTPKIAASASIFLALALLGLMARALAPKRSRRP
jgi:putative spermidine/putrescine transport system permease protein